jgi:hypothetical protein
MDQLLFPLSYGGSHLFVGEHIRNKDRVPLGVGQAITAINELLNR